MSPSWSCLHGDLPEARAFLNHCSFGLSPRELKHWRYRLLDQIECDPVAFLADQWPEQLKSAREHLAYVANLHKWLCCPRGSAFFWLTAPSRSSSGA